MTWRWQQIWLKGRIKKIRYKTQKTIKKSTRRNSFLLKWIPYNCVCFMPLPFQGCLPCLYVNKKFWVRQGEYCIWKYHSTIVNCTYCTCNCKTQKMFGLSSVFYIYAFCEMNRASWMLWCELSCPNADKRQTGQTHDRTRPSFHAYWFPSFPEWRCTCLHKPRRKALHCCCTRLHVWKDGRLHCYCTRQDGRHCTNTHCTRLHLLRQKRLHCSCTRLRMPRRQTLHCYYTRLHMPRRKTSHALFVKISRSTLSIG
jgi:hypothetical protein